ncbi:MAG: extracellular solute-binding protein [Proteobacteria bacterium]|nr:extracellular solute-binding protein [Pseudomonadota bacterium]
MTLPHNSLAGGIGRRSLMAGAGLGVLGAAAPVVRRAAAADPLTLTVWSWVPNMQKETALYEQANPGVTVNVVDVGQGFPHYAKIEDALRAGSGGPDVAQIEFDMIATFLQLKAFADLAPYGASKFSRDYVPWAWQQVTRGDHVYALPWDSGPIGQVYRKDILDAHGMQPAGTWGEFADQALKMHKDTPNTLLTNATFDQGAWTTALLWQAGWKPFTVDGDTIGIDVSNAVSSRFAAYWQKLLDAGAVDAKPGFVTEWYEAFDKGRYAIWIVGAWGPVFLQQFAKSSSGKWRAAPIPQLAAGGHVCANWGGSTLAVLKQSQHRSEAAKLATWLLHNPTSTRMFATDQYLFPTSLALLNDKAFLETPYPFYGNQPVNEVFAAAAHDVNTSFQWSPFQGYVQSQMGIELDAAANGRGTLQQAFDRLQKKFVKYANEQGFTVKT